MPVPIYVALALGVQILLGVLAYKKRQNNPKGFTLYIYTAVGIDLIGAGILLVNLYADIRIYNLWLYELFAIAELMLLGFLLVNGLGFVNKYEVTLKWIITAAAVYMFYNFVTADYLLNHSLESLILFLLALGNLLIYFNNTKAGRKYFYISTGVMLYFGVNSFNFLAQYDGLHLYVHSITNIAANIFYIGALYERN